MSPAALELALKKQRLQLRSAALRDEFAAHATTFTPLFTAGDRIRDGARWLHRHPEVLIGVAVAALVARPRVVLRWVRRVFFAWRLSTKFGGWLDIGKLRA
jgi:hypothetical protein